MKIENFSKNKQQCRWKLVKVNFQREKSLKNWKFSDCNAIAKVLDIKPSTTPTNSYAERLKIRIKAYHNEGFILASREGYGAPKTRKNG